MLSTKQDHYPRGNTNRRGKGRAKLANVGSVGFLFLRPITDQNEIIVNTKWFNPQEEIKHCQPTRCRTSYSSQTKHSSEVLVEEVHQAGHLENYSSQISQFRVRCGFRHQHPFKYQDPSEGPSISL